MKNLSCAFVAVLPACATHSDLPLLQKEAFAKEIGDSKTSLYTLKSTGGLTMQVTNYGARIVSLFAPDREGKYADIVIGKENIDRYIDPNDGERFLGCVVGRYANRIGGGTFSIGENNYQLPLNNNGQTLHGGLQGFDRVVWNVDSIAKNAIQFSCLSPDGADGFPGNLLVKVTYELTPDNACRISYSATTDKPTVVNLSNHAFFNLKGEGVGTITDHILTINADYIVPVDSTLIPTGELLGVDGTPFDFRIPMDIGEHIGDSHPQLKAGNGYDHCWVLNSKADNDGLRLAAILFEPTSGRMLEVYTDQPGMQFYAGNFFDGKMNGKYGTPIGFREALALETQKFPDSPNHSHFPSTMLNPNEKYTQTCIYKFSAAK